MSTVEFRCMIQDIVGTEAYYQDDKLKDRTVFYCITIPGENEWVRTKGKNEFMINGPNYPENVPTTEQNDNPDQEKINRLSFSLVNWSYPIPSDGKNRSCLMKVYDISLAEHLRVNDIVQVSGSVELDDSKDEATQSTDNNPDTDAADKLATPYEFDFEPASDFPHRLVPRVHVKALKKLNHINPLLPDTITRDVIDIKKVKLAKARMSTIFTQLFGGDTLAAEYLILLLISRMHMRKDVTTLGQLTVGFSGIKPEMKFLIDKIYDVISKITTHSHYIDMSIANLNNLRFRPEKDNDNNKMIAGTLQLPDGLLLLLNETSMSVGSLTTQGLENLSTLNRLIRWQRLNYNFKFHTVEIDTDLKVLIFSEGKSLLTVPYDVRLDKNDSKVISSMRQACESVDEFLTEELLNLCRYYITALKDVPDYSVPESVQISIQDDFVKWRKEATENGHVPFSADDLSSYMTLARYLTISRGETVLTDEIWKETCQLESTRKSRTPKSIPTRTSV